MIVFLVRPATLDWTVFKVSSDGLWRGPACLLHTQCPRQEEREHIRHRHEVQAPLRPLKRIGIRQQRKRQQPNEGRQARGRHDVHAAVGDFAQVDGGAEEDDERDDRARDVDQHDLER